MQEPGSTATPGATGPAAGSPVASIVEKAKQVITGPEQFFEEMPRTGGFGEPLLFMVAMGVVSALVGVVLSLFGLGFAGTFTGALVTIISLPILAAVFGFVSAAILFVIWKLMGSQESYETAYRCGAYMTAITPITSVINVVPYAGVLVSLAWGLFLVVTASRQVHKIKAQTAWIVFGILAVLVALMSIGSRCAAKKMNEHMTPWLQQMENMDEMNPEEAGKAMGDFLKGFQQSLDEQK